MHVQCMVKKIINYLFFTKKFAKRPNYQWKGAVFTVGEKFRPQTVELQKKGSIVGCSLWVNSGECLETGTNSLENIT